MPALSHLICAELDHHTAAGCYSCAQPGARGAVPVALRLFVLPKHSNDTLVIWYARMSWRRLPSVWKNTPERKLALRRCPFKPISVAPATGTTVDTRAFRAVSLASAVQVQTSTQSLYILNLDRL